MTGIREYLREKLMPPLKRYPTRIQDTLLEIITVRLEELYRDTIKFPEIVSAESTREDIIDTIAEQFVFMLDNNKDVGEQLSILESVLAVYRKRGSVETIENMWKYYGGDLPKDVEIHIPAYDLFRYNVSTYSTKYKYQDGSYNRTGAYEIILTNNQYPIDKLREFLIKELVAAGNLIYFTNRLRLDIEDSSQFNFKVVSSERDISLSFESSTSYTAVGGFRPDFNSEIDSDFPGYFVLGETNLGEEVE